MSLVSVIIPVYNGAAYLAEAIDSVIGQSHSPCELIVIDDGSTDESGDIALKYGESVVYRRQDRAGNGAARNAGAALSTGNFLSFLDADDRWLATKLVRELAVLAGNPRLSGVRSLVREFVSPEIDPLTRNRIRAPHDAIPGLHHYGTMRREAFDRLGGFATSLQLAVGVDFGARWTDLGLESEVLDEVLIERRLHESNNWTREAARHRDLALAVKATLDRRRAQANADERADGSESE